MQYLRSNFGNLLNKVKIFDVRGTNVTANNTASDCFMFSMKMLHMLQLIVEDSEND